MQITKEEIDQYIKLDNKIKARIVELSEDLIKIPFKHIADSVPFNMPRVSDFVSSKEILIENRSEDTDLIFGGIEDDSFYSYSFDKNLLCISDEQVKKILKHHKDCVEEERKQSDKEKAEKAIAKAIALEKKEYQDYLRLKEKFEGKNIDYKDQTEKTQCQ